MGPECTAYHQNLADKIANKSGEHYSKVQNFIIMQIIFHNHSISCALLERKPNDSHK